MDAHALAPTRTLTLQPDNPVPYIYNLDCPVDGSDEGEIPLTGPGTIIPLAILKDGVWSALVEINVMFKIPDVAAAMVRPVTVTVTAVLAAIDWAAIVMTIWVLVGVATVPVAEPLPLIRTPGVPVLEKNREGYVSVMVPPVASAPPAVVVNENVAEAPVLPATRSDTAIAKEGIVT